MAAATPANNDGNCLPPPPPTRYHDDKDITYEEEEYYNASNGDTKGAFQPLAVSSASEEEIDVEGDLSLNELMYSAHSFHVISLPVSITMILAALAVTYINTPETIAQGEQLMSQAYHVWKVDAETDSTSKQLALDFANSLVIVSAIGAMTFGIVLLYKYRCMKVLIGYMMFSSMTLLGVLGAELFDVAIDKFRIPIGEQILVKYLIHSVIIYLTCCSLIDEDRFSFVFILYNFAVVGVTAIFYQNGIPPFVTQCYLIASSVIIAWQLSHFDTISTWTLLVMLALYDLCAVLTPCGPLKALVNLMSDEGSPQMPGLLYEAQIPDGLKRPVMRGRNGDDKGDNEDRENDNASQSPPSSMCAERYQQPTENAPSHTEANVSNGADDSSINDVEMTVKSIRKDATSSASKSVKSQTKSAATGNIPFAIAKLYRLPLISRPPFADNKKPTSSENDNGNISTSPLLSPDSAEEEQLVAAVNQNEATTEPESSQYIIPDKEYTPAQLRTLVEAVFPKNGAKIVKQSRRALPGDSQDRYGIIGSDGTLKRILFVEKNGKVYEELDDDDDSEGEGRFSNTIKLGLGDFIFVSLMDLDTPRLFSLISYLRLS